jgi:hypothetical protein
MTLSLSGSAHTCVSRRIQVAGSLLLLGLVISGCEESRQEVPADVALRIGKEPVHYSAFEAYLRANVDSKAVDLNGKTLSSLLDLFLDELLLERLAASRGLLPAGGGDGARDGQLAVQLLLEKFEPRLEKAELEKYYFEHLEEFRRPDRVRLRQILVYDRPSADKALAALRKGESFAEVAARFSQDPRAQAGGDQGVLGRDDLPPSFGETIFRLGAGETSQVVEAEYGFQIFKVDEVLPATVLPFESVRPSIEERLRRELVDRELASLLAEARQKFKVEIFTHNVPFVYQGAYSHAKP